MITKSQASRMAETLRTVAFSVPGMIAAGSLVALLIYPPAYVARVLAWQNADVND
jgi:hypothetical protein